jgi:hypothetical protein
MTEIRLTGLAGANPLGALAAFGLLRCCEEMEGFQGARLGWTSAPDWFAVLETDGPADGDSLVAALVARQKNRSEACELNWASTLKTAKQDYLTAASQSADALNNGHRYFADFLTSFACELQTDDNGQLEPTAFYMTSGQQKFLKEARTLADRLAKGIKIGRRKKGPEELFREALFGPWKYEDPQHSLGLDPSTERLHALRAKSPTKESSEGVTAAVWLAFEALPLFPCFLSKGTLATTGFHTEGKTWRDRTTWLTWPVWRQPVPLDTLRSLLSLPELAEERPPLSELRARGIEAVFRSERYRMKTQGAYYILRPACLCM